MKKLSKKNKYPHNPPLPFVAETKTTQQKHIFQRQAAPVHNKAVAHATKRVRLHWLKAGCDRLRMSTLAGWVHHLEDGCTTLDPVVRINPQFLEPYISAILEGVGPTTKN